MKTITAKITHISEPLPSRSGQGAFICVVFRDVNDTAKGYKTHINSDALNRSNWVPVLHKGIVLSGLEPKHNYKGLINADSCFAVAGWHGINEELAVGDRVLNADGMVWGSVEYKYTLDQQQDKRGQYYRVRWCNGKVSDKRSYEVKKVGNHERT